MKVEELCIGDYANYEGKPVRIKGLCSMVTFETNEHLLCTCGAVNIDPIPLTPEILKKNGFTREEDGIGYEWWVLYGEEKEIFTVGFGVAKTEVGKTSLGWTYHTKGDVDYPRAIGLHEFQQALRLAGIEDEIEV